jgi:hypothetical protein
MPFRFLVRAAAFAVLSSVFLSAAGSSEPMGVRVFVLKYKRVEEATLLVRPLLSDSGSILLQPKINALTITDRESVLNAVARALAQFDLPPRSFAVAVKIIRASADLSDRDLSREIGGIGNKLREVFRFKDYALIDSTVLHGSEGDSVSYLLGGEYRLGFRIEPAAEGPMLRFSQFSLFREKADESGHKRISPLIRTTLNVALNQTMVIGASKEESSKKALILVIFAQENPRPMERLPGPQRPAEARR